MKRAIRLLACVAPLFLSTCCCDDDDDCWWTTECYWSSCCYTCHDVQHCDHYYYGVAATGSEDLDFDVAVADAGDGRIDVLVRAFGRRVDGATPIGVRLIGPGISDLRRESPKAVWGFFGIPTFAAERIEAVVVGTAIRAEKKLPIEDLREAMPCDPRGLLLERTIIAPAGDGLPTGTEITLAAPRAEELLAAGAFMGLEIECFQPDDPAPIAILLREGETSTVRLDRTGRWAFRSTLLTDDVCGDPSADSMVVEEVEIDVR